MTRAKSNPAALKGAHQLLNPNDDLSALQQHVVEMVNASQAKKQIRKRKAKQAKLAQAARARRHA